MYTFFFFFAKTEAETSFRSRSFHAPVPCTTLSYFYTTLSYFLTTQHLVNNASAAKHEQQSTRGSPAAVLSINAAVAVSTRFVCLPAETRAYISTFRARHFEMFFVYHYCTFTRYTACLTETLETKQTSTQTTYVSFLRLHWRIYGGCRSPSSAIFLIRIYYILAENLLICLTKKNSLYPPVP